MEDFLKKLNPEQRAAVLATDGPLVVLAGAGSGKTRVLVYKVLYLILEKNVPPNNILMVTFTNKAAGEMKERITKVLASQTSSKILGTRPTVGTFHSLCAKILRIDGRDIGLPNNFVIYDQQDQLEIVKEVMKTLDISIKQIRPKAVLGTISSAKNQMIYPESYTSIARGFFQESVAQIYPLYQKQLRENFAVDFDDLMLETIRLLKTAPHVLAKYQNTFQYVLVDEYQDTNHAQFLLTKMLSDKYNNICVVGDFSQSIYSFRGADFRNLEKFREEYKDAKVFPLSQNYRSTQKILDAAHSVISRNNSHPVLSLWTENKEGEDIKIMQTEDEHNEAELIINYILERKAADRDFSFSDVAVLYRMNAQSRALEETFLHHSIPYVLVGGTRFYDRREVKDVLAFLSHLANPKNTVAINRIEKIGKKRKELFLIYENEFLEKNYIDSKQTIEVLDEVTKTTGYLELYDPKDPEDLPRLENIKELRSVAFEFPNLLQFLENVALVQQEYMPDKENGEKQDAVTLMTLHAAKGLEFKMVFMVGMEEGLFPHSQSFFDKADLEEERRLCYVGITRAKEHLFLSFARQRLFFGQRLSGTVSRFIYELPEDLLKKNMIYAVDDAPDFL